MAKVVDGSLEGNEFELQLYYYVHSRAHALTKGMNPIISTALG